MWLNGRKGRRGEIVAGIIERAVKIHLRRNPAGLGCSKDLRPLLCAMANGEDHDAGLLDGIGGDKGVFEVTSSRVPRTWPSLPDAGKLTPVAFQR